MKKIIINSNEDLYYLIDSTFSFFYTYKKNATTEEDFKNSLQEIIKDDFESTVLDVTIEITNKENDVIEIEKKLSINDLLKEYKKDTFIEDFYIVKSVIKTNKNIGLNITKGMYNITSYEFNKFFKANNFIKAKENNIFTKKYFKEIQENQIFKIFKKECPNAFILLKNLFYKENEDIISNFLNYLSSITYNEDNQDVIYLFKGTSEDKQGQGAGKGILKQFLNNVLGGLVTETSNERYRSNFNLNFFNKKIIILDEFDFDKRGYNHLKNLTGSKMITIEKKGKDTINVKNTASWLIFTNQYEIPKNFGIIEQDRRLNIINVNPESESLGKLIHRKFKKENQSKSMDLFFSNLINESEKFINILGLYNGDYLKPCELKTNTHIEYFKSLKIIKIEDFEIEKLYLQYHYKKLKELLLPTNNNPYVNLMFKYNCIDYTFLTYICELLTKLYNFRFKKSSLFYWNLIKNESKKNKLKLFNAELRETKSYKRLKKTLLETKKLSKDEEKFLKIELRDILNLKK